MSSANNDQKTNPPPAPSSGLGIGLIVGGVLLAMILIGVVVYFYKRRQGSANLAPPGPPTAANGLGVANQGTNAVPSTTMNVNAGRARV
jgi:Mg/Co/Ni transporter MgtE